MIAVLLRRSLPPAGLWLTTGLLSLAGCGAPPPTGDVDRDHAAPAPSSPMAESSIDTSIPVASPGDTEATSRPVETAHDATEVTAATSPAIPLKTALEATDPAQVVLDDGTPHLVEFFAFW